MLYPNIRSHQCIFLEFFGVMNSLEFRFSKIFKCVISRLFVISCKKKKKIGFGVGVISCDFWVCFLKSALYRAMYTTCMCFDVAKTDVKKGVNFVSDLDVKAFI